MLSENGRLKTNKTVANKDLAKKTKCLACGHVMPKMIKIFGEQFKCDKCGSDNIEEINE